MAPRGLASLMRRVIGILMLPILACRPGAASPPSGGEMAASWTGSTHGAFRAPATALWCARDTLLELIAVRNDTAVGFALFSRDSLHAGIYPMVSAKVAVAFRPRANAAARWLDQVELKGYEGSSGKVTLSRPGASVLSGTFEVGLHRTESPDTLVLKGSFARVPVGKAIEACGRANRPGAG
jgi:hypothetical protein